MLTALISSIALGRRQISVVTAERAGSWARREARSRNVAVLKRIWRPLTVGGGLLTALTIGVLALIDEELQAFAFGLVVASAVWAVAGHIARIAGASSYLLGSQGEIWTAEELRPLLRDGWRVVHHVPIDVGTADVDHVLVGPSGVYALETKTSSRGWDLDRPDHWLNKHLRQARYGAQQVRRLVHGRAQVRTNVRPVLVLWGDAPRGAKVLDGVDVVAGLDLATWLESQPACGMQSQEVIAVEDGLIRHIELGTQSADARSSWLVDVGPSEIARQLWLSVMGGIAAFFLVGFVWSLLSIWPVIIAMPAAAAAVSWRFRRVTRFRPAATGALTVCCALAGLGVGALIWAYARAWLQ